MATLAIKGHATRGREVIQLLEMLGGENAFNLDGTMANYYYYIDNSNNKIYHCLSINLEYGIVYTLEEFEEKFPYKVDDVVVNHKYGKGLIIQMLWIDNEIVYEIHFEDCMAYCKANELCKFDALKDLLLQELTEYLSHATREELDKTMEEIEIALAPFKVGDKVIVKGYEKMGEDEIICVFKTYDGNIKYKTKNHLDAHYFMEDSLMKVEKSNKEENMEKRLEPVYELGTGKILYYEEKGSGEKYIPIGETTLYIQEGYEFRDETNNVINAKRITLVRKQSQYPKTYEELIKPKFKVGDKIKYKNGKNIDGVEQGVIISITDDAYDVAVTNDMGIFVPITDQYEWELIPNKFDIANLKPFEKVLVRQNVNGKWGIDFFGFYTEGYYYTTGSCIYVQCIPYEENKHLIGTTNNCDEYYKTWE